MAHVMQTLNSNNVATITGPNRSGKSTSLHYVALKMEEQGYELVPAEYASDILNFHKENTKQLFVFDDVLGESVFKMHLFDEWYRLLYKILNILKTGRVKLLVSSQTSVFRHPSIQNIAILTKSKCELTALSESEKRGIASRHMSEEDVISLFDKDHVHECQHFLHLCSLYKRITKSNEKNLMNIDVKTFFSNNVNVIKSELESLMKADDQSIFAVLLLFVFCNNHIDVELISMNFDILKYVSRNIAYFLGIKHSDRNIFNSSVFTSDEYSVYDVNEMINTLKEMSMKMNLRCRLREILQKCRQSELPKLVLKKELRALMKVFSKYANYHKGVVYMLEIVLSEKLHFERVIDVFSKQFKLPFLLSKNYIQEKLCSLTDLYASECQSNKSVYTITNDRLLDIIVSFCGENLLNLILTYGHSKIIRDKFLIKSSLSAPSNGSDCLIMIEQNSVDSYFDRLVCDICNGDFEDVFENSQLREEQFCMLFANYLSTNFDAKSALLSFNKIADFSPLHIAAHEGLTSIVKVLLDFGLDIESKDYENSTALIEAIRAGHYETSSLLIERGADCNAKLSGFFEDGCTPLWIAVQNCHTKIVKLLLDKKCIHDVSVELDNRTLFQLPDNRTLLQLPVEEGRSDLVELLLESGFDPDVASENRSLIYCAVLGNKKEIVELLLNYNSNPNLGFGEYCYENKSHIYTPLIAAVGNIKIIEVLLVHEKNPANPNFYNSFGETSLHYAAKKGYLEIVKLLLEHYADPSIKDGDGHTAGSLANDHGHYKIVEVLSEHVMNDEIPKCAETKRTEKNSKKEYLHLKDEENKLRLLSEQHW